MGRLIDADVLRGEVYSWGMNDYEPSDFTDAIDDAPTIEAIPKADYENRLKADLVAMLEDLQVEIDEEFKTNIDGSFPLDGGYENAYNNGLGMANQILKSKINKLKENEK